jgi:hypothetical protein
MTTANETFAKFDTSTARVVNKIHQWFLVASPEDIMAGKTWYAEARQLAEDLSLQHGSLTVEQAGVMIAQLSPRLRWDKNKAAAIELCAGRTPSGVIGRSIDKASQAMREADPWVTFGKAPKTRSFAANILGNEHAVTVDVWAARAAGFTEAELSRAGVYEAIAHAYRLAAKRAGITPAQMQAIVWTVVRGSAT